MLSTRQRTKSLENGRKERSEEGETRMKTERDGAESKGVLTGRSMQVSYGGTNGGAINITLP